MENITVNILSNEYQISCPKELKTELRAAVDYLHQKMLDIKSNGKIINFEKILVNAAINLAFELIQKSTEYHNESQHLTANLTLLHNRLNQALSFKEQQTSNK